jgi:hypothetical protein
MWTLVNASYGLAMGQRPTDTAWHHDDRRRRSAPRGLPSTDPRLEAAQARRRDHLAQAANEQRGAQPTTVIHPQAAGHPAARWAHALWTRLRLAGRFATIRRSHATPG